MRHRVAVSFLVCPSLELSLGFHCEDILCIRLEKDADFLKQNVSWDAQKRN